MAYDQKHYDNQSTAAGSMIGSMLGGAVGNAVQQPEMFNSPLMRAEGSLDELMSRAERIANRLCGPVPPSNTKASLGVVSSGGVFDDIAQAGQRMHTKLGDVHDILQRIEQQLP